MFASDLRPPQHVANERFHLDDRYAINLAKTEIRLGYHSSDPERILAVYAEGVGDMSDGMPSFSGAEARSVLRARLAALFTRYTVRFVPIAIEILLFGDDAVDYGWHELTLTPRSDGPPVIRRSRYMELWKKGVDGQWRIALLIDNQDQQPVFADQMITAIQSGERASSPLKF